VAGSEFDVIWFVGRALLWVSGRGLYESIRSEKEIKMRISGITARAGIVAVSAAGVLGGFAAGIVGAPTAAAAPDCSASGVANTVSATTGSARQYLDTHPGANQAVTSALSQPRPQASASLRGYFTAHPREYYDLRGILSPIGDTQRSCNITALPPALASAYDEFMAG
jgi:hemophore-related protein